MTSNDILTDPEIRRFSKQMLLSQLGKEGQEKLKQANVVVIGVGGLGTTVLQYLAASGVGNLGIIDYTLVDETNIQRQTLYGGNDLGKLKSIISKQHLQNLFPLINFEIINLQLTPQNITRIINSFDLIVDATNDDFSHQVIADACLQLKLPCVYGSIDGFEGEVSVVDVNDVNKFQKYLSEKIKASASGNEISKGVTALAYGLVGNLMALETVKFLINSKESLKGRILYCDLLSYNFSSKSYA